jgi:Spy/CpxP family protein refolding chaperone
MKKTLLILASVVVLGGAAIAQVAGPTGGAPTGAVGAGKAGGHAGGARAMGSILQKLNLTPAQQTQVKTLEDKMKSDHKALELKVKGGTLTKEQAKPEMQTIRKTFTEGIMKVLTPDQKKQLATLLKEARKNRAAGAKPGTSTTPPPTP